MPKKLVIDVDTGTDDAQAIMLALSQPDVDVIAITCVHGNVDVENVCRNTLRVLKVCNRLDIPVYKGAECSLLGKTSSSRLYHGTDGLGDCPDPEAPPISMIQEEHAVSALSRLSKQYPGEITLVALAPLTNVALTLRMDPHFGERLKQVVIMGGNMSASGCRASLTADYNFVQDPEAAHVCVRELASHVVLLPYDVCTESGIEWDKLQKLLQFPSKRAKFLGGILQNSIEYKRDKLHLTKFFTCDPLIVMIVCDKNATVTKRARVRIELRGEYTRGLSVLSDHSTGINARDVGKEHCVGSGNTAHGNIAPCQEYNFHCDPEAAYVSIKDLRCPIIILPLEPTVTYGALDYDFYDNEIVPLATPKAKFHHSIITITDARRRSHVKTCAVCDVNALSLILDDKMITKSSMVFCTVELTGSITRGQLVVDWKQHFDNEVNVQLVIEYDLELFKVLYKNMFI